MHAHPQISASRAGLGRLRLRRPVRRELLAGSVEAEMERHFARGPSGKDGTMA